MKSQAGRLRPSSTAPLRALTLLGAVALALASAPASATGPLGAVTLAGSLASVPDPATYSQYGWCYNVVRYRGTRGRIYYPPNGGCGAARFSPLVLFMAGNGYDIADYHVLFKHLAKNGYIVVAPDIADSGPSSEIPDRADRAWDFLTNQVLRRWSKRAYIDTQRTVLMGHSRGGEGIRFLPAHIAQDNRFDVAAMVALAPTNFMDVPVTGQQTPAVLYIVGSLDEDISTMPTYESADYSGHSGSQLDPIPQPGALYRSVKLVHGATHVGFTFPGPQMDLTRGYVLAFLHAHVRQNLTFYETYIRGSATVPGSWSHGVTTQYRDGLLRRVIDDFDDGQLSNSSMDTNVTYTAGAASQVDLSLDPTTPHVAQALRFEPPFSNAIVRWTLPAGRRDARAFKMLSLRIGQVDGPPTDDLWIQVRALGQPMVERRLSDFGPITQPQLFCPRVGSCFFGGAESKSHMGTIRIPVAALGNVSDVRSVTLVARSEAAQGTFIVDDVEFSEWIYAP